MRAGEHRVRVILAILITLASLSFSGIAHALTATGTLKRQGITTYMYGSHVLLDDSNHVSYALTGQQSYFDGFVGQKVSVTGSLVPGYPVDGGPPCLQVQSVTAVAASAADPVSQPAPLWRQSKGPYGGYAGEVIIDPGNPQVLYAGTLGGVFKSTNGGSSWSAINNGVTVPCIAKMVISRKNPQILFAGTSYGFSGTNAGHLYKSSDGGASWGEVTPGATKGYVYPLATDPNDTQTVYATVDGVPYKSTDGAATWSAIGNGLGLAFVASMVVDPMNSKILFAGTSSTYEGLSCSVFKSTDGGLTWTSVYSTSTLFGSMHFELLIDPGKTETLYGYTSDGKAVVKTTDLGITWSTINVGPIAHVGYPTSFLNLAVDWWHPGTLYYAGLLDIAKSNDGGVTWTILDHRSTVAGQILSISPTDGAVYVASDPGGVRKSGDGGTTWTTTNTGLIATSINGIAIDPSGRHVYAGTCEGLFSSKDAGWSWTKIGGAIAGLDISSVVMHPLNSQTLYVGAWEGGVFKTTDGGASWTALNKGLPNPEVASLVLDRTNPDTLYAATNGTGVYKSTDGGGSWTLLPVSADFLAVSTDGRIVYASSHDHVFKSGDGGISWTESDNGLTPYVQSLAFDPGSSEVVYAASTAGLFKTSDGGKTWVASSNGLTTTNVYSLAIDPNNTQTIYAGTLGGGIFRSSDGGGSWTALNSALIYRDVGTLAVSPLAGGPVYAGVVAGGIFSTLKPGDCNGDGVTTVAEVQSAINMYLGIQPAASCADLSGDSWVSIAEVARIINAYLGL